MKTRAWTLTAGSALLICAATGCHSEKKAAAKAAPSAAQPAASASAPDDTPKGCQASGDKPVQIGSVLGDVEGFGQDSAMLYYTSWQLYGSRGDFGTVRKDGQGGRTVASLALEPQSLAVGDKNVYFTTGIRLMSIPKTGGDAHKLVDVFSSKHIALFGKDVLGVPGDYGPYDRLAKIAKTGGAVTELASGDRPKVKDTPNGYSRVRADDHAAYVTDSGNGRILAFPLPKGKYKVLASHLKKPFDLVMGESTLYFNQALDGQLMSVPKKGGKAKKLASGLVKNARIAGDARGLYAAFAGKDEDAPEKFSEVSTEDGSVKPIATIPALQSVSAVAVDKACVYWVVRQDAGKSVVYARKR
jgi:hypothetical protein